MEVAIFLPRMGHCAAVAPEGQNVYNRRCQPADRGISRSPKPQRGVTVTPRWGLTVDALAFRRLTPPVIDISLFQSVKNCNFHATLSIVMKNEIGGRLAKSDL